MDEILLRPHHALCIRFFEGKGYSGEFTRHMAEIIRMLQEPGRSIVLVDEEDEICRKCPNHLENGCRQKEKVKGYDGRVIDMTGVSCERKWTLGDFRSWWRRRLRMQENFTKYAVTAAGRKSVIRGLFELINFFSFFREKSTNLCYNKYEWLLWCNLCSPRRRSLGAVMKGLRYQKFLGVYLWTSVKSVLTA
ncbi:MAG: DUF1284 domain-containing protein [Lachnospiraceae bacterium]|nr:DUF1284 domain-containing protein [Lachnospiraceae bacterium]